MLLIVEDLAVARGGIALLEAVAFTLAPGQALILRGPNGIGKTTLLRAIAGLQPPLRGRVDLPADGAAYAGHADGLKATLTVAENLAFWARIYGQRDTAAAIAAMDLGALADRPAQNAAAVRAHLAAGGAALMATHIDLGLAEAATLDLSPFRAKGPVTGPGGIADPFDAAFA